MSYPKPILISELQTALSDPSWDSVVIIAPQFDAELPDNIQTVIQQHAKFDQRIGNSVVTIVTQEIAPKRLVLAPTGQLTRYFDDVRRYFDAAKLAAVEVIKMGSVKPLLVVLSDKSETYKNATTVSYLGFSQALWQPLEAREYHGESIEPVQTIGLVGGDIDVNLAAAIESGKYIARDLCGTEPERMAPPQFAQYCVDSFANSNVKVSVVDDMAVIERDYPLMWAVARASVEVERHQPRVIRLEYIPEGEITKTLMLVGKGIVYDTGGADLKTGGHMAGMSRDKGGAAAVAGFMKSVAELAPKGVKVVAELAAVRNSIGAEAFVSDEIITGHSGVRVRIGNTDAEGRLAMADLLSRFKDEALTEVNPILFTVATLTGHAARAVGPYTALVENGVAYKMGLGENMVKQGDLIGDPCETSRSRREDYDFVQPRTKADDLLSSNNGPSAVTARGHQFPMAFLALVAGLEQHDVNSTQPMPYIHIDIAGSGVENGDWQHGKPTAAPVAALLSSFL
ncbi:leucyl aminopeptidase family protein [Psychrosphaera sp. 1_MG-2023]|uniref:M17 family metallopeptidase n=1 Tax=Psychrosphaera sp. 1_MG-2023 TaxID=3062643 RepID=UPI0026E35495|nr:leucyl aminopeptidase family protein [Psychrosphaera sp. 1_MG-2023]MDO6718284.1 leucyl aminopeptidase family protein [Psychrosphaera sp. 1_MG-2023]